MELSKAQASALRLACQTHGVAVHTNTARALERRGLVTFGPSFWGKAEIRPTETGRAWVARETYLEAQAVQAAAESEDE